MGWWVGARGWVRVGGCAWVGARGCGAAQLLETDIPKRALACVGINERSS